MGPSPYIQGGGGVFWQGTRKRSGAGCGRPEDGGVWTAKTVKRPPQQPAQPQYANYWAPLTRKRHIPPHPAQPRHTNHWAPRTQKRHQQEHRPQRPTESSNPTQHAKGRTGDCPGPRKGTTARRNSTHGGGVRFSDRCLNPPPNFFFAHMSCSLDRNQKFSSVGRRWCPCIACQDQSLCWCLSPKKSFLRILCSSQDDNWRMWQLRKHLANPEHPFHKFSTGIRGPPRGWGGDGQREQAS